MHLLRSNHSNRSVTCVISALALALGSCVYRPVVVDDYSESSSYTELLSGIENDFKLQNAIDENVKRVMRPGEQVANWSESGVDLDDVIGAVPGGTMDNVFLSERAGDIAFSSKHPFLELFGPEYTTYSVSGADEAFEMRQNERSFGLTRIGEGVWFETSGSSEEVGNASCVNVNSAAARFHTKRPFSDLSKLEKSTLVAYAAGAQRDGSKVCTVGEADGEGRWRSRYFLPDGRQLPVFDREGARIKIVPRAEAARLITGS